jgi:phosphoenolpyruvate synthase/pyruvate phosphate dikinase
VCTVAGRKTDVKDAERSSVSRSRPWRSRRSWSVSRASCRRLGWVEFEPDEAKPMIGFRGALRYTQKPKVFQRELNAIGRV